MTLMNKEIQTHNRIGESKGQPSSQQQGQDRQNQAVHGQVHGQQMGPSLSLSGRPPIRPSSVRFTVAVAACSFLKLKDTQSMLRLR